MQSALQTVVPIGTEGICGSTSDSQTYKQCQAHCVQPVCSVLRCRLQRYAVRLRAIIEPVANLTARHAIAMHREHMPQHAESRALAASDIQLLSKI